MQDRSEQDCRQRIRLGGIDPALTESNPASRGPVQRETGQASCFEILAITQGEGNGWIFSSEVLQRSLALWDGVECFLDHGHLSEANGRSVRDLAGVIFAPGWDGLRQGIRATLRTLGPGGSVLASLGEAILSSGEGPRPDVGFSADVRFAANGRQVQEILHVYSVDLVLDPARGGQFIRALNQRTESSTNPMEGTNMSDIPSSPAKEAGGAVNAAPVELQSELQAVREARSQMSQYMLDTALAGSGLPTALSERIRKQFQSMPFTSDQLQSAIGEARSLLSELTGPSTVQGPAGGRLTAMFDSRDQLQAATDDLFGLPCEESLKALRVQKLSGIRELYLMLTGDDDLHGGYHRERVRLATTADFTGLVKNALNKIVVNTWEQLGRAGYDWWSQICVTEHFSSLNDITGTLVGTIGDLPMISEGGAYTELPVGDSPEVASFVKYGGYIPLTLELIDRDETRKLSAYAREMASAGLRKISKLVADIFTSNGGTGPMMADSSALFNNHAVSTAGGHKNLLSVALTQNNWDVACAAVYDQPMLVKNAVDLYGSGPKMALNPRFCLVPRPLQLTARQILLGNFVDAPNAFYDNLLKGSAVPVTVPDWTDANDWAAVCDPQLAPAIYIGERFGIMPEVYIAGDELSPAVFSNDEHRLKVRHYLAVWVNDYRPLLKSSVGS